MSSIRPARISGERGLRGRGRGYFNGDWHQMTAVTPKGLASSSGRCKLCHNDRKLVKSHIIPDWAYKRIYDSNHRILSVASNTIVPIRFPRTGEWDRFVCSECEEFFKYLDDYGRAIVFSRPGESTYGISTQRADYGANVLNVDYARMKLFQISILWRAGISDRPFFEEIVLGAHEPILRQMLVRRVPGDAIEYGCVMAAVKYAPKKMLSDLIARPFMSTVDGWSAARFFFAGCLWDYVLHDDAHDFPTRSLFLAPGAPLPIIVASVTDVASLMNDIKWLQHQIKNTGPAT